MAILNSRNRKNCTHFLNKKPNRFLLSSIPNSESEFSGHSWFAFVLIQFWRFVLWMIQFLNVSWRTLYWRIEPTQTGIAKGIIHFILVSFNRTIESVIALHTMLFVIFSAEFKWDWCDNCLSDQFNHGVKPSIRRYRKIICTTVLPSFWWYQSKAEFGQPV